MGLILTAQLIILDLLGRYSLSCWTAASATVVWIQHSYCQKGFASSVVSDGVPLGTVWHFSLPEMWILWLQKDWVRVQCWCCKRLMNIVATTISKKEGTYDTFCHWGILCELSKFAKIQVFKKADLQVPWGLQKCFLFGLSLWSHIVSLSPVTYFKKISQDLWKSFEI